MLDKAMIEKILVAVDGSENSNRAVDVAAELGVKLGAELHLVHVLMHGRPTPELMRMAEVEHIIQEVRPEEMSRADYSPRTYLETLKSDSDGSRIARVVTAIGEQVVARAEARCSERDARVATKSVRSGDCADEILEAAGDYGVDLIVVGTRGLGRVRSAILGSVSQKVLHNATCNVLLAV